MKKNGFRIYFNARITLGFCLICLVVLLLSMLTGGESTYLLFSTYRSSLLDPLTYIRLIGHVFGHASWSHLTSNLLYILLLGPMLEEKYHDRLIVVIVVTALVTGIMHSIIDPDTILLGASGVVFAFILLASVTGRSDGIPITLILVAALWLGNEFLADISTVDTISHITHIIGGISGAALGMFFKKN
ncbi:MAG: rhomboid family intramembrane serine protease [Erysipelotrichaceae bacterium]|nr:rhomboid family intramembrane serine protease [Erysipelotrichaceae bacterium]